jgi:predicted flap endonuclease-1-like 5' DNA nuclease
LLYSDLSPEKAAELQALAETAVEELGGAEVTADFEVAATPEAAAAEAAPVAIPIEATVPVAAAVAAAPAAADDLTQIRGVGPKTADALKAAGIDSYAKLASTSEPDLRKDLADGHAAVPGNVNTWAMQASFAAKGDWVGMMAYAEKSEPRKHEPKPEPMAAAPADDLTQLSGIGPKASQALAAAGITTYAALTRANEPQLRQALHDADMVPPGNVATWPMQATYAVKGDWAGLAKHNQKAAPKAAAAAAAPAGPPDDLTKLSGIGPRIETLLNESGITTYEQLRHASVDELRASLAAAGALPPSALTTWPTQAAYAVKGDWTGLASYNQSQRS